ncbi:MAG: bifunctional DNA primase/polymerase, partial [Dehalococcoidia bacterium]|nr:bifunctional DNA primase/polymerase [Dehalococcoidia bacterium]
MADSALDHALRYAKLGLGVFPLRKLTKAPATPQGFHDASTVPEVIKAWWKAEPDYGVGLAIPEWMVVV